MAVKTSKLIKNNQPKNMTQTPKTTAIIQFGLALFSEAPPHRCYFLAVLQR